MLLNCFAETQCGLKVFICMFFAQFFRRTSSENSSHWRVFPALLELRIKNFNSFCCVAGHQSFTESTAGWNLLHLTLHSWEEEEAFMHHCSGLLITSSLTLLRTEVKRYWKHSGWRRHDMMQINVKQWNVLSKETTMQNKNKSKSPPVGKLY